MGILENKVAIVTGAGSGIGREIALQFVREGAKVVLSDLNEQGGSETLQLMKENSKRAVFIKADSSSPKDNERLVHEAIERFGQLQVAVNNAGISGPLAPVGEYPIEGWDKVISINLSGVFYGMHYQIPALLKGGGGAIVNVASILGQVGTPNAAAYVSAKHGVIGLTQTAALEYSSKKIRINAIGPGYIKTPLLNALPKEAYDQLVNLHPMGRLGESSEVAELITWISSDKASFVTGAYYPIDGGYLAQ